MRSLRFCLCPRKRENTKAVSVGGVASGLQVTSEAAGESEQDERRAREQGDGVVEVS